MNTTTSPRPIRGTSHLHRNWTENNLGNVVCVLSSCAPLPLDGGSTSSMRPSYQNTTQGSTECLLRASTSPWDDGPPLGTHILSPRSQSGSLELLGAAHPKEERGGSHDKELRQELFRVTLDQHRPCYEANVEVLRLGLGTMSH